jgi:uncharacterized protein YndB with AHSA1/START domain
MADREPVIRRLRLPAPREEVWRALTSPELLSSWLGDVLEFEARPGGAVTVREGEDASRRGLVEAVEPSRSLVFRWRRVTGTGASFRVGEATRVAFVLEDEGDGTLLTVTEEPMPLVASGGRP